MQVSRLPDGKIHAPFTITADDGVTSGEGMQDLAPGDPGYDEWDQWLKSRDARADTWTVTGEVDGKPVTLTWNDGIANWPQPALDWATEAMAAGEVMLDDGPGLLTWLQAQGFTRAMP